MGVLLAANLVVRFLMEIAALAAVAAWAAAATHGLVRLLAVPGAVLVVGTAWTLLVHGDHVPDGIGIATQVAVLAVATTALAQVLRWPIAAGFAALALINAGLMTAWDQ